MGRRCTQIFADKKKEAAHICVHLRLPNRLLTSPAPCCIVNSAQKHYNEWRKKRIGDPKARPVNLTSWIPWKQH